MLLSAAASGGANLMTFVLPIALIAIFYLLLIRPQRKRQREVSQMQQELGIGQKVLTGSGMVGEVTGFEDDYVVLELSPGTSARFVKQAIVRILPPADEATEADDESSDDDADESGQSSESTDSRTTTGSTSTTPTTETLEESQRRLAQADEKSGPKAAADH